MNWCSHEHFDIIFPVFCIDLSQNSTSSQCLLYKQKVYKHPRAHLTNKINWNYGKDE